MKDKNTRIIQERDKFTEDLQDMMKAKKNIERKYEYDRKSNKERETKLTKDLARVNKENNE